MTKIHLDFSETMTVDGVKAELKRRINPLARTLFPDAHIEDNGSQVRVGNKGSLVLDSEGVWFSFEDGTGGDLLKLIQQVKGYPFMDALRWAEDFIGDHYPDDSPSNQSVKHRKSSVKGVADYCRKLWSKSEALNEKNARYFVCRGLFVDNPEWYKNIRFLPRHLHRPSGKLLPCMIAKVHDHEGRLCGLSRTYLHEDFTAKAGVSPNRMLLGNIDGGAVRLTAPSDTILVTEGIEDALALMKFGEKRNAAVWAALGANLANFKPPQGTKFVIIAADNDEAGERFSQRLEARLRAQGVRPTLLVPVGAKDFAQLAEMGGGRVEEIL